MAWQGSAGCEGLLAAHQLAAGVSRAALLLLLTGVLLTGALCEGPRRVLHIVGGAFVLGLG